jgi:hypothetical protein
MSASAHLRRGTAAAPQSVSEIAGEVAGCCGGLLLLAVVVRAFAVVALVAWAVVLWA